MNLNGPVSCDHLVKAKCAFLCLFAAVGEVRCDATSALAFL
jgi:hypothetical protein